jgi:hypothetical protein
MQAYEFRVFIGGNDFYIYTKENKPKEKDGKFEFVDVAGHRWLVDEFVMMDRKNLPTNIAAKMQMLASLRIVGVRIRNNKISLEDLEKLYG